MTLKAGDLVYRVVQHDPPGKKPHTWKIVTAVVEHASTKQIKLKTYFQGLWRTRFEPHALGSSFFETPRAAIQYFLTSARREIETLESRRKDAERAIAWATSQEGMP